MLNGLLHRQKMVGNMSEEILVKCENVSKKFCRGLKRSLWYGVQDICSELNPLKGNGSFPCEARLPELRKDEFWAVNNISFELRRGECLGLIGHNGAGKSTLLKMLNGLIKPDHGRITIKGRISAIIDLNAGFNPVLTGRENVYIYGAILGFTKEDMDSKYQDIVEFAELADFMEMPFRSYSSGMKVRLGFAVAAQMEPDVLIVDEVLAVGDVRFRQKSYLAISKILKNAAVVFVSHSISQIYKVTNCAMLLDRGKSSGLEKEVGLVVNSYLIEKNKLKESPIISGNDNLSLKNIILSKDGDSVEILSNNRLDTFAVDINYEDDLKITFNFEKFNKKLVFHFCVEIFDSNVNCIAQCFSANSGKTFTVSNDSVCQIVFEIHDLPLNRGAYYLNFRVFSAEDKEKCIYEPTLLVEKFLRLNIFSAKIKLGIAPIQLQGNWSIN